MATPRDPAAHTVPNKTIDDTTTQPDASTSAAGPQAVEDLAGLSTGRGGNPALNHEEDLAQAGEASSAASRGPAAQVAAPTDDAPSAAMPARSEQQNMQDDSETTESHDLSTDRSVREEHATGGAGSAEVASATLPIRTSSARAAIRAAPAVTGTGSSSTSQRDTSSRTRYVGPDGQVVDLGSIMFPHRPSSGTETAPRLSTGRRSSLRHQLSPSRDRSQRHRRDTPDFVLPRWQPDAEVTLCPICNTQFSIWVRKHHCRKCGRVVCNSCSPHRITIPNQYIVRPPDSEVSFTSSLFADPLGASLLEHDGMAGGERVRLCNPCVPDPNTAPPQNPTPLSPRSPHHRSRSSLSNAYGGLPQTGGFGGLAGALQAVNDPDQYSGSRTRSIALNPPSRGHDPVPTSSRSASYQTPFERYMSMRPSNSGSSQFSTRPGLFQDAASSSQQRALPPTPQIAEEDECPVCHRELPATTLPDFEALREQHITACILSHSTYGSPAPGDGAAAAPPPPRRSGMYTYPATEKDCVDDAECTICLEEFAVGVPMARLECLCRFHRACIAAWFVNHPGRCPVHQHDGFGF
ncbi:hypothetical protein ACQRIT_006588 [Beauveria bassiana]